MKAVELEELIRIGYDNVEFLGKCVLLLIAGDSKKVTSSALDDMPFYGETMWENICVKTVTGIDNFERIIRINEEHFVWDFSHR